MILKHILCISLFAGAMDMVITVHFTAKRLIILDKNCYDL